jgi:PTH1 family peptidyl-tRNA hydrolase
MKIILAQGNPGIEYTNTRHNVGFTLINAIADTHNSSFLAKPRFMAEIAEFNADGEKVLLVKPTTFYNETGQTARSLVDFYKCDPHTDLLVIHDDLALPFGTIRTREKGSDAGNNGIKSINNHLGPNYARLRIGIYNDDREKMNDTTFVLSRFPKDEVEQLPVLYEKVQTIVNEFIMNSFEITSHS